MQRFADQPLGDRPAVVVLGAAKLGNYVVLQPLLRGLRRKYPQADITYVGMKPTGTAVSSGASLGEVESVKTTSDIYSALAGTIVEVNAAAASDPSLLNSDPFGKGWLVKIKVSDTSALDRLMDSATYDAKHPVG